jgi:hypothetical protein
MAFARQKDPADRVRRTRVTLQVVAVTLTWLVTVPILLIYGLTGQSRDDDVFLLAAFLTVLLPFVGSVVATRGRRFGLGGAYVVLTLLMVIPAAWMIRAG